MSSNAITRAVEALEAAAEELAGEIECRYESTKDHPAMKWRYERDMETVTEARATLAALREYEVVEGWSAHAKAGAVDQWIHTRDKECEMDRPALLLVARPEEEKP
jgi:hypothetical protein